MLNIAKAALGGYVTAARLAIEPYVAVAKAIAGIALLVGTLILVWRVHAWHDAYKRVEATEKALATSTKSLTQCTDAATAAALAYVGAVQHAESTAASDRAISTRVEHELQTNLGTADARARDLARRLHDSEARRCGSAVPTTPDATGRAAVAGGEPGDGGAVEDHFAACARDAARLDAWREWWAGVTATH